MTLLSRDKQQPNIMSYQNYKPFDSQTIESVISKKIEEKTSMDFEAFKRTIINILDKHTPWKKSTQGPIKIKQPIFKKQVCLNTMT